MFYIYLELVVNCLIMNRCSFLFKETRLNRLFEKLIKWFFLIFLFLSLRISIAQNQQPLKFTHLSLEEGLSQSVVFQTIQDKDGFLWFGTQDGLNKYDGYKFIVFRNNPNDPFSLSNNCVLSILEDYSGDLWIGTRGGGLNKFDRRTERFSSFINNPKDTQSLSNNFIYCLYEDTAGSIWIGTNGGGLNQFNKKTGLFKSFIHNSKNTSSISSNVVYSIAAEDSSTLWIGTSGGGLNCFDKKTQRFKSYMLETANEHSLSNNNVRSVYVDASGAIWVGTEGGGLNRFNRKTEEFIAFRNDPANSQSISNNFVYSIYETSSNELWVATYGGGINIFNRKLGSFTAFKKDPLKPESLSSNYPLSLFEDRSKTIWIGTYGGGLSSYSKFRSKFNVFKNDPLNPKSISSNAIRTFCIDKSNVLWVGTRGGGLNWYDRSNESFTSYKNDPNNNRTLSNNEVYHIIGDNQGLLWIGTRGGGINKFNSKTGEFSSFVNNPSDSNSLSNDYIYYLLDDEKGSIWIGTDGGGLNRFDKKIERFTTYKNNPKDSLSISDNIVITIYKDKKGNLWVGTRSGGLNVFDLKTGKAKVYKYNPKDPQSIPNNSVLSIVEDIYGTIWVGTDGGGLNRVDIDSCGKLHFKSYSSYDGLPNNCIYGIVCDKKSNLWLSTNKGISRFSPYINKDFASKPLIHNYDFNDGLPSNEFNTNAYYQSIDGTIYFGAISGMMCFNPDSVVDNSYKPPVVITGFQLFNKEIEVIPSNSYKNYESEGGRIIDLSGHKYLPLSISRIKRITLAYSEKVFTFEFASLDFSIPQKNKFEYIMEGFDKDWNSTGTRRFATYTNLPPGHYTFKVRGTNCDDLWSDSVASMEITILPPFWKTIWFRLFVVFCTVTSIVFYIKRRESKLKEDKDILEATVKERTIQLKDANEELNQQNEEISTQRDNLQLYITELKQKNEEILAQRDEIHKQSKVIELKNLNITASIAYAENIQKSILPSIETIRSFFSESFVFFKPKDVVSGDFYWLYETDEKIFFAVIDCTGHGVPGALMSVMGFAFLRKAFHESVSLTPADILNQLSIEINSTLRKSDKNSNIKDGMDIALCALNRKTLELEYAGAHNPIIILRNKEIVKLKPDNHPIGDPFTGDFNGFNNTSYQLLKGDKLYLYTDGLVDQFGGPKGQKFSSRQFEHLIITYSDINLNEQEVIIDNNIELWRSGHGKTFDQTDDITLMGIKI